MKIVLKRIVAYIIDIILVSLVATLITSNSYINKDYKKYNEVYVEYNTLYENYIEYYQAVENNYKDSKITDKEYKKLLEFENEYTKYLIDIYDDEKVDEDEYESMLENINSNYSNIEINYSYKLLKYSKVQTIITIMCILLYFTVIQFYFNGKTLGKKIMKLKIVSNNDKSLTISNFFIRCLLVNEVFINILNIIFLSILSKNNFLVYNKIIYLITYILEMVIMFTIVFNKNNRGLHDYVSNTKVIEDKKE